VSCAVKLSNDVVTVSLIVIVPESVMPAAADRAAGAVGLGAGHALDVDFRRLRFD
jgi:hypothetical protein